MTRSINPDDEESPDTLERRLDIVVTRGAARPGRAFLLGIGGEAAGKLYPLTKSELVVGRAPTADIRVPEKAVSHFHAQLMLDGPNCSIRDLDSTNGTFVNGEAISGSVAIAGGDTISVGGTAFTYLAGGSGEDLAEVGESTIELAGRPSYLDAVRLRASLPPPQAFSAPPGRVVATAASQYAPATSGGFEEDGMSMTDVVRKIRTYWVYVKRYGWLVFTCTCFGIGVGVVQTRLSPPPGSAWFEVTLTPQGGPGGPMGPGSGEGPAAFQSPETTFTSLALVRETARRMGAPDISAGEAAAIKASLALERPDYNEPLWRGEFQDATAEQAAEFLDRHLDTYLTSETEKVLGGFRAETAFWKDKASESHRKLMDAEAELLKFQRDHPEVLPRTGNADPLKQAKSTKGALDRQLRETQAEITRLRGRLKSQVSLRSIQLEKAKLERDKSRRARDRILELRSQGLGELHPEVKKLRRERAAYEAEAARLERTLPSESEVATDSETLKLREQLTQAEARQRRLQSALVGARNAVAQADNRSLPELRQRFAELKRTAESGKTAFAQASKELEAKQLALEMELRRVRAHYAIITHPTPEPGSVLKASIKRSGIGGVAGLFLALCAALILEFRARWVSTRH